MRKSNHHAIRMLLQQYHDGLSIADIADRTEKHSSHISRALSEMPDAYIDRWIPRRGVGPDPWCPIWCVVVPPENCPKPNHKPK